MSIITFWSENEKAIGQTISTITTATTMAIEHNYKILLISLDFNNRVIENCFGAQDSNKEIVNSLFGEKQINLDSGINGLLKIANSNRVTPEIIHDYTKIIFKNRLEVLYPPMDLDSEEKINNFLTDMKVIILNAARYYDQVFVDLKKGFGYVGQSDILNISDVVVLNVDQNIDKINEMLKFQDINKINNKTIWNICKYDKNSKYNTKNLSRKFLKNQLVGQTDYNTLVLDASQEGELVELLLRFKTLREVDNNFEFMKNSKDLTEKILLKYQETRGRI